MSLKTRATLDPMKNFELSPLKEAKVKEQGVSLLNTLGLERLAKQPSSGHSRRLCRILASESWRQVRHFKDCLIVSCGRTYGSQRMGRAYRGWCATSDRLTEFLWNNVRPRLPTKNKKSGLQEGKVFSFVDQQIPESISSVLKLGPKHAFEPTLDKAEKLTLSRSIAKKVEENDRPRCITECVEVLERTMTKAAKRNPVGTIAKWMCSKDLRVLLSDKEGCFTIFSESQFQEKALAAVMKNFELSPLKEAKVKEQGVSLLNTLGLERLAKQVGQCKKLHLDIFFTAKTHKVDVPFRAIVSERSTWQHHVSKFFQRHLSSLDAFDPLKIPNSDALVSFLKENNPSACAAFSIDVTDLYYSLPHDCLLKRVKRYITDDNDEMAFVTRCGMSVENFLELVRFYLHSTFIGWQGKLFAQKSGVCIGSSVAPVLSDIFLLYVDRDLEKNLSGLHLKTVRYVDDYLIFVERGRFPARMVDILKVFRECGSGLQFTFEAPVNDELQFLDVRLHFEQNHVCWKYNPRSSKTLLNSHSGHSKLVKNSIISSCLRSALTKSCHHTIQDSFQTQLSRVKFAGYQDQMIAGACSRLIQSLKRLATPLTTDVQPEKKKFAVLPYVHRVSHGLKNVASRYKFTFEAPVNDELQFLDVRLHFEQNHVCWKYNPRSSKTLLNSHSGHSKLVKNSIISSCLRSALTKSCHHTIQDSFQTQLSRVKFAGYQDQMIAGACSRLIQSLKRLATPLTTDVQPEKKKFAVLPYVHRVSHGLKNVASRYKVGHSRRLCRILASESWRQVRHFKDCLIVSCGRTYGSQRMGRAYRGWCATSDRLTEFLWNNVRPRLPTKNKKSGLQEGKVFSFVDQQIPESISSVLKLGPKHAFEPTLDKAEKLTLSR
ncbi:uncharacterized protein LOC144109846 [Amblyomma americanum]